MFDLLFPKLLVNPNVQNGFNLISGCVPYLPHFTYLVHSYTICTIDVRPNVCKGKLNRNSKDSLVYALTLYSNQFLRTDSSKVM